MREASIHSTLILKGSEIVKKNTCIWDLSGTLFRPRSDSMSLQELADFSFLFLMWSGKKLPSRLDIITYTLLSLIGEQQESEPSQIIRDHRGQPVPEIICAYLSGRINSLEAKEQALSFYESWAPQHIAAEDQIAIRRMIEAFFDPMALVTCMKPIEPIVKVFRKTLNTPNNIFILSNWDQDSFKPFYDKYKDSVFQGIDREHFVISADTGYVKPQKGIYTYLLAEKNLTPKECFFVDDQQENIAAAQRQGIEGMQCKEENSSELEAELQRQGLL